MPECPPPVFYTLAVVRHEPLARLDRYLPEVQDALRKHGFTGQIMRIEAQQKAQPGLTVGSKGPADDPIVEKSYRVFTPDHRSAFTFNNQGIFAHHTTSYTTRAALFDCMRMGLEIFNQIVQLQQVNRVSIRMLDLIRPSDFGYQLRDFVQPSLLGFRGIECLQAGDPMISSMEQSFRGASWEAQARFDCLPDGFGLNSNLLFDVQGFTFPEHVVQGGRVLHGILDTDSGSWGASDTQRAFDLDQVMTELADHKTRISQLFRAAVTPTALKVWGLT